MLLEQLIVIGVLTGCVYALVGVSFTVILGVGKIANFAQGSFVAVGLYAALFAREVLDLNAYEAVIPAAVFFVLVGFLVAELFEWRGRKVGEVGELLVGLALLLLIEGILEFFYQTTPRSIQGLTAGTLGVAGLTIPGTELIAAGLALVLAVMTYLFLKVFRWGRALRAVAENADAAGLYGVHVPVARRVAVVFSIVTAGVAGIIISPFLVFDPDTGSAYLITAFAVVVLGGIGNAIGAVVAGVVIGLAEALAAGYLSSYWTTLAPLILILAVLLFRPDRGATI